MSETAQVKPLRVTSAGVRLEGWDFLVVGVGRPVLVVIGGWKPPGWPAIGLVFALASTFICMGLYCLLWVWPVEMDAAIIRCRTPWATYEIVIASEPRLSDSPWIGSYGIYGISLLSGNEDHMTRHVGILKSAGPTNEKSIHAWPYPAARFAHSPASRSRRDDAQPRLCRGASGYWQKLVNGAVTWEKGALTGAAAGTVLRS